MVKISAAAEIPRSHTAPHAWRRGFAVGYLRGGGDIFSLQQILGHTILEMTLRLSLCPGRPPLTVADAAAVQGINPRLCAPT